MAERYQCRPSELLKIKNTYDAYCLDEAIFIFGNEVQSRLDAIKEGKGKNASEIKAGKQEVLLKKILGITTKETKGSFQDPAMLLKGR